MGSLGVKLFQLFMRPIQRLPLRVHYVFGKIFTFLLKNIMRYRRDDVIINLSRSFPTKKYWEIKFIANQFYNHLGEVFAETMWFGGCKNNPQKLHNQHIYNDWNKTALIEAYNNSSSIVILSSHFGNWEIIGGVFEQFYSNKSIGINANDVCVVYRQLSSKFFDVFMADNRTAPFKDYTGYIETMSVLRYAFEHRKDKKIYVFPTDQYPYGNAVKHKIPSFMHQETFAMTGGAALAHKFGMAVFYMGMDRKERGKYNVNLYKICDNASTLEPHKIMEEYYNILEKEINSNPANYLWSHKRWK